MSSFIAFSQSGTSQTPAPSCRVTSPHGATAWRDRMVDLLRTCGRTTMTARSTRGLGDESRLRMLRFLTTGSRSLSTPVRYTLRPHALERLVKQLGTYLEPARAMGNR